MHACHAWQSRRRHLRALPNGGRSGIGEKGSDSRVLENIDRGPSTGMCTRSSWVSSNSPGKPGRHAVHRLQTRKESPLPVMRKRRRMEERDRGDGGAGGGVVGFLRRGDAETGRLGRPRLRAMFPHATIRTGKEKPEGEEEIPEARAALRNPALRSRLRIRHLGPPPDIPPAVIPGGSAARSFSASWLGSQSQLPARTSRGSARCRSGRPCHTWHRPRSQWLTPRPVQSSSEPSSNPARHPASQSSGPPAIRPSGNPAIRPAIQSNRAIDAAIQPASRGRVAPLWRQRLRGWRGLPNALQECVRTGGACRLLLT